jgi:hypothetical protein
MLVRRPLRHALRACLLLGASAAFALLPTSALGATQPPIALGVNIANAPDQAGPLQSYVSLAHQNPAIVMWYQQWSEPLFYSDQLPNVSAVGAIPMITWDPIFNGVGIPLSQITAGRYDAYIKSAADAAAASKNPMYIRLGHEMNVSSSLFGPGQNGNTPAAYVAAWRHVVTIFRQQGATNVEWVWSPNVDCGGKCPFTAFYPGDAWVDWVALDGYNYATVDNDPWMTFDQIFAPSYAALTHMTSKPVMIGETASTELGGNKAQWIAQTFQGLASKYPHVHAVVWFDRNKETNWMVNSSAASLAAWQQVVTSPLDAGSAATLMTEAPTATDITAPAAKAASLASVTRHAKPARRPKQAHLTVHRGHVHHKSTSARS